MPDDPFSRASLQRVELVEVNRLGASGLEIGIEESGVAYFIQRVAGYVLRAIAIQVRQGYLIVVQRLVWVYLNGFVIADTTQFRILCPKIRLDQFRRRQKPEDGGIALIKTTRFLRTGQSSIG
jgi:hypothetical protein